MSHSTTEDTVSKAKVQNHSFETNHYLAKNSKYSIVPLRLDVQTLPSATTSGGHEMVSSVEQQSKSSSNCSMPTLAQLGSLANSEQQDRPLLKANGWVLGHLNDTAKRACLDMI